MVLTVCNQVVEPNTEFQADRELLYEYMSRQEKSLAGSVRNYREHLSDLYEILINRTA